MFEPAKALFYAGIIAIAFGTAASIFPLWKSRRLSPASIQRRVYWSGSLVGSLLLFVAVLPDWRSALFVSLCAVSVVVVVAFRFTIDTSRSATGSTRYTPLTTGARTLHRR